jgi:hypothetical protein
MKRIMLVAALATVAACNQSEPAPAPEAANEAAAAAEPAAAVLAADGQSATGTYKVTTAEGEVVMEEVRADGTYVDTVDGKVVETGRWVQKSPEQYCYTKDEEGATEVCNVEKVDANGVWTSTGPDGKVAKVERVGS